MVRLIQIQNCSTRGVAVVEEPRVRLLDGVDSVVGLGKQAIESGSPLTSLIHEKATDVTLDYDPIYNGQSEWRLLPAVDHPDEPARCLVSGTGLTHLGGAKNRHAMHGS